MKSHWKAFVTVSLPRIRDARAGFKMPSPVSDRELAQAICVLRTALPDCGITLSTREDATLRDKLIPLGITQMSAGSVTMPGGYTKGERAGAQFAIEDRRSPQDVAAAITKLGYDPVWKDWDIAFRR
jgi:2-iminoacetate synthase